MHIHLDQSKRRFVFLLVVTAVYFCLVVGQNGLSGPAIWDENSHWQASLFFRDRPLPTLQDLNNYGGLNTPLPFIVYGAIERWFGFGIPAARWLNLILSLGIVFAIGWPRRLKTDRSISTTTAAPTLLCLVGLLTCPYFAFASVRLYTEMMACFWAMAGYVAYVHQRHALSCLAFILAIASRQYMLAFPMAIATYELATTVFQFNSPQKNLLGIGTSEVSSTPCSVYSRLAALWPFFSALLAVLSIVGWVCVFGGLTPKTAIIHSIQTNNPASWAATQQTTWSIRPAIVLNYLAYVGFYLVIPEWILFGTTIRDRIKTQRWWAIAIILSLLLLFCLYPPLIRSQGLLMKLVYPLPVRTIQIALLYVLALLACLRFSRFEPVTLIVFFYGLMMLKAHSWDRYVLPVAIVFWYAKSMGLAESSSRFFSGCLTGRYLLSDRSKKQAET